MQSYQSIELITSALAERGFSYAKAQLDGQNYRVLTKASKVWVTPYAYVHYPFVSETVRVISKQKELAYNYVSKAGYAVPATAHLKKGEPVDITTLSFGYPMVVKPVNGAGSIGVVRNITDDRALLDAISQVHLSADALVQRQFSGQEIRLTIVDGVVVSTCLRAVPQLVGDGTHTLAELLAAENQARAELSLPYITYPQLTDELITRTVDMAAIPAPNEVVILSDSTLISGGASVYNVDQTVHDSYKTIVQDMAHKLNASFLIVDLLVADYQQAASDTNYVFLEFNTAPALKLYYSFRDGKQFDILPLLTQKIEAALAV